MQWTGYGMIIGLRRHGESSVIVEAMVKGRGRHLGLVRGGRSPRNAATLQPGNDVQLTWRARLDEHLGTYTVEMIQARAADLIADRARLYVAQLLFDDLRLLPERDPHDRLMGQAIDVLDGGLTGSELGAEVARFELGLLDELGFGLDLTTCAVTGATAGLTHVSPKSGRAVSREAAQPYLDRLLPLPGFLRNGDGFRPEDIAAAFALTGHFLAVHVWQARQIDPPATRDALIAMLTKSV